jgi:hypothetical protein
LVATTGAGMDCCPGDDEEPGVLWATQRWEAASTIGGTGGRAGCLGTAAACGGAATAGVWIGSLRTNSGSGGYLFSSVVEQPPDKAHTKNASGNARLNVGRTFHLLLERVRHWYRLRQKSIFHLLQKLGQLFAKVHNPIPRNRCACCRAQARNLTNDMVGILRL